MTVKKTQAGPQIMPTGHPIVVPLRSGSWALLPPPTAWKAVALLNELHPLASDKHPILQDTRLTVKPFCDRMYKKSTSRGTLMADDRWLYKLLGIEEDEGDEDLRESGIPPALLFMRGLMRQGGGGGGDIKTKLAQVLSGAGNAATQIGRGAQDLGQFAQQRAGAADQAFQQGLDPIGNIISSLPQIIGGMAGATPTFANPMAQQAFGQAVGDVGQAITGVGQFFEPAPIVQLAQRAMAGGINAPSFRVTSPPGVPLQKSSPRRPITNRSIYMRQEAGGVGAAGPGRKPSKPSGRTSFKAPPKTTQTGRGSAGGAPGRPGGPYRRY